LAVAEAGSVQTTIGLKWTAPGTPSRLTLYFEELSMVPDRGLAIARELADQVGVAPPSEPPSAAAVDYRRGEIIALKLYHAAVDRPNRPGAAPLPGSIEAFRRRLPFHVDRRTRRLLIAQRFDPEGGLVGRKLLWVPEVRHGGDPPAVWDVVASLISALQLPESPPCAALRSLQADPAMYPDLVSLDTDAAGTPEGLTVYVAVLPERNSPPEAR
jgi:hypothetical protein